MAKLLITPSLYSSYSYYTQTEFEMYGDNWKEYEDKARDDFLNTLKKIRTPTTPAMQRGIDFENYVVSLCNGGPAAPPLESKEEEECAKEIAEIVKGGVWQQVLMKEVGDYLLYGKADNIKRDKIYDIKRTSSYEVGKYQNSIQHDIYLERSPIDSFKYLVCDGRNVYHEDYFKYSDHTERLIGKINGMVSWIRANPEFAEPFEANWKARG